MTTISQAGGIVYIQQSGSNIQYQRTITTGSWTNITSWPVRIINTNPVIGTVLTLQLFTDITISAATGGANGYFIMGSQYVTFDGDNNTVTIDGVALYPGAICNGGVSTSNSNVTVRNVGVLTSGVTSLADQAGWVCQNRFSSGVGINNNIITNCYSTGVINGSQSGGICGCFPGLQATNLTITNCYSTGSISQFGSGGICGSNTGQNGSVTITGCYSFGAISDNSCGGICGSTAGTSGSVTIINCYSLGAISGQSSGGICGNDSGSSGLANITNCYSLGAISGLNSGGICGGTAARNAGSVTIISSYSLGAITGTNGSGGICGAQAGVGGSVTITNCYSYGNFATLTNIYIPGMVGTGSITTGITNYYVARGTWSDTTSSASGALTGTPTSLYVNNPGATWTTLATNTPYILSSYNAQLYSPNSYINPSGYYTSNPGLIAGNTYSILSVNNGATPSSITIDSGTGVLTFNIPDARAVYNVKVLASRQASSNYYEYNVNSFRLNQLCFKEGSKILCLNPETNSEEYIKIENLRKGDLVKTFLNGYKPISHIGYSKMYNKVDNERTKDKLYKCCKEEYPEIFEDLVITAAHSILVDDFVSDEQKQKTIDVNGDTYVTERKYRLPACVDERAKIYEVEGEHMIYHLALEHEDYYKNYGVYANGLLVETSSNRMMVEYGMTLI